MALSDAAYTTGQLHRMLPDFSEEGIRRVLGRLTRQGIVVVDRVGNAYRYQFNRDHLAAGPIIELASLTSRLLARIENLLSGWTLPPVYAAVFGSVARGTSTADSDLDILLVRRSGSDRDVWDSQVAELSTTMTRWTGNDTRPLEYSVADLASKADEPVLRDILSGGLTVAGDRAWLIRQLRKRMP